MKTFISCILMCALLAFHPPSFAQTDTTSTAIGNVTDRPSTIEKIDQAVDEIGQITGVDTLETIDEAIGAIKATVDELKEGGKRAWYEWVLSGFGILALLLGLYKLVRSLTTKNKPEVPPIKQ